MRKKCVIGFYRKTVLVFPLVLVLVLTLSLSEGLSANILKPASKISFRLEALAGNLTKNADQQIPLTLLGLGTAELSLPKDNQGQYLVYIRVADTTPEHIEALKQNGASVTCVSSEYNMVTAYVNLTGLKTLAALDFVKNISEVIKPVRNQAGCLPAITSEGDSQLKADKARTKYLLDGTGVTVGVLSDSYAGVTEPTSAEDDILSGDLPGTGNPCGHTTPVVVLEDYLFDDPSDEGRGMMQIVHDLAPGADLAFATAFTGIFGFANNIIKLRSEAGADVIVDDVSYYSEPFFQDGPVTVAIDQVTADGAMYFSSAGNSNGVDGDGNNISSYEAAAFRPTECPTLFFNGEEIGIGDSCHNFNPDGDTPYQEFVLADTGYFNMNFQWAEPWYGVETDLDFYITDSSNNILAYSANINPGEGGTQIPFEYTVYQNISGANQTVRVVIARYEGTNNPRSKYILSRSNKIVSSLFNASNNTTDIFGPTIMGHHGGSNTLSIAAVRYNDSDNPEYFTSQGNYTVYYGPVNSETPADPLAAPEVRIKPDVAATDGGANTFFGQLVDGEWRFYGTSAAAPHAAAVAALMDEKYYGIHNSHLSQAKVEKYLEESAAAIANGSQLSTGAGLVDALKAIAVMLNSGAGGTGDGGGSGGGCFISAFE